MKIENLTNGAITFFPKQDGEERSDFFSAAYFIECTHGPEGIEFENSFHVATIVECDGPNVPYREIEDAGAQALPAFFRDLADAIEQDLLRVERERSAKQETSD
jgi:hypothetical protein